MKYARHFIVTLLIFLALLVAGIFLTNQPSVSYSMSPVYSKPVTIDVCNQNITRSWTGAYESQGCATTVGHDWNYYYQSTVNNGSGTYVPYMN